MHVRRVASTLLLLAACVTGAGAQEAPRIALRFASLVDGTGATTPDAVVVVQADTIVAVGSGDGAVPRGAWVMDLRPYTAIPGLIDVHTHMTQQARSGGRRLLPPSEADWIRGFPVTTSGTGEGRQSSAETPPSSSGHAELDRARLTRG
jgi:hypothetical protein